MQDVQRRILESAPTLEAGSPKDVLRQIRRALKDALDRDLLKIPEASIYQHVRLECANEGEREFVITGGIKDFRRSPESARLIREDLAWLHFTITVRHYARDRLEVLSYDFELVFPDGHAPPFVRFDLNPPGHRNEARELRSHVHPGNDELQLPAPVMTPTELLELLLVRLRPRDRDHVRT